MLKPVEGEPPPQPERPIGELVQELVDDGKTYARAEIGLAKAIAAAKANALKLPAILFGAAFLVMLVAFSALALGTTLALAAFVGPLAGGVITFLLFAAIAGLLGWLGVNKLQDIF